MAEPSMICALVLAAGRSRRMGTQKLLLPLGGQPVIARVVDTLLRCPLREVFLVVGADADGIKQALAGRRVNFVPNPAVEDDMLSSVRCGLRAMPAEADAVLVVLGDQPALSAQVVSAMLDAFARTRARLVVPVFHGARGHPLLLSTCYRDELLTGHERVGLRGLLQAHPDAVLEVSVPDAAVLDDLDTPEDYQRALAGEPMRNR
ncbi:MAG: nucleotidyltransferase family protein [Verrucomicrobia bacterium]|nr:nucleotidyltransferase family protein [Verrucomicrobiota bacterium]